MGIVSELPAECVEVLRVAAVIGETFDIDVLAAVIERPSLDCLDALSAAIDENVVVGVGGPERYRFVDAATHHQVLDPLSARAKVQLHARVAETLGSLYGDQLDAHIFELAGHWSAAAIGDHRVPAAGWISRAAAKAEEGSPAEAARLYRRAIDVGVGALDDASLAELWLGLARASYRGGDVVAAAGAVSEAATLALRSDRGDLVAQAALVVEPSVVPGVNQQIREICEMALAAMGAAELSTAADTALRVRLWARLADVCHYLADDEAATEASRVLDALLVDCEDLAAVATALHAQQLAASDAHSIERRVVLADQLARLAKRLDDPVEKVWSHLWRIDIALQRGDLSAAAHELKAAIGESQRSEDVMIHWELLRARSVLAQAQARFDDAIAFADKAEAVMTKIGNPLGQFIWMGQRQNICHHTGLTEGFLSSMALAPQGAADADTPLVVTLATTDLRIALGDPAGAAAAYRSLGPAEHWRPALHSDLFAWAYGIKVAAALGETRDVTVLRARLEGLRGLHVATGAGAMSYFGPVELWLGIASAYLGDHDAAIRDLETARVKCAANGAAGFLVECEVHLAHALLRRAAPGDALRARPLAEGATERAHLLGMPLIAAAGRAAVEHSLPSRSGELTRREREVALLVAQGLTNRAIARQLHLSERTAANHVQHILDKLDLENRAQIGAWVRREEMSIS